MSKPLKTHMATAEHLFRYLAETVDFAVTYKQGGIQLTTFPMKTGATNRTTASRRHHILSSWRTPGLASEWGRNG